MSVPKKKRKEQQPVPSKRQPIKTAKPDVQKYYIPLFLIVLITFIAYLPALHNGFVNWDDDKYIQNNPLIQTLNLKKLFSSYIMGNYHPITIFIYALEYHFFGLSETGYHTVNLLLHLANTILVFYVVLFLNDRVAVALVASLLFGIHPLHVESVAWASQLKDLLYTFFFLLSYICYLKYLKDGKQKFLIYALFLFACSILSKAMGVVLPAVLLLTDYLIKRKLSAKVWLEKAPFLVIALIFGVVAVLAQKSTESIQSLTVIPFYQRIIFACFGFVTYLQKLFIPHPLCAFYPYPINTGEPLPAQYYIYPVILLILAAVVIYSIRYSRKMFFGFGFFTITIFLVLQLLPVGDAIMADRYSYLPSIGIFYLAGEGFYWLWNKKSRTYGILNLKLATTLLGIFTVFFSVTTYARCQVWKNGFALWDDVISQYQTVSSAYLNRGTLFMGEKRYDEALSDYSKAIELQPNNAMTYNNRGLLFVQKERFNEALSDYTKAIKLEPGNVSTYTNRGIILAMKNNYVDAIKDFNKAIYLQPDNPDGYMNRGISLQNEQRFDEAINDYSKAIDLQPNSPKAFFNRGIIKYNTGLKEAACLDILQAAKLGFPRAEETFNKLCQ